MRTKSRRCQWCGGTIFKKATEELKWTNGKKDIAYSEYCASCENTTYMLITPTKIQNRKI